MPDDRRLGEPFRLLLRWNEGLVHAHVALDKTDICENKKVCYYIDLIY